MQNFGHLSQFLESNAACIKFCVQKSRFFPQPTSTEVRVSPYIEFVQVSHSFTNTFS